MPVLPDAKKEKFCLEVASGTALGRAYDLAGFGNGKGHANPGNASRMARREPCRSRIRELKDSLDTYDSRINAVRERFKSEGLSAADVQREYVLAHQMQIIERAQSDGDLRTAQHGLEFFCAITGIVATPPPARPGRPRTVKATGKPDPAQGGEAPNGRVEEQSADPGDEDQISKLHSLTQELDGAAGDEPEAEDPAT